MVYDIYLGMRGGEYGRIVRNWDEVSDFGDGEFGKGALILKTQKLIILREASVGDTNDVGPT